MNEKERIKATGNQNAFCINSCCQRRCRTGEGVEPTIILMLALERINQVQGQKPSQERDCFQNSETSLADLQDAKLSTIDTPCQFCRDLVAFLEKSHKERLSHPVRYCNFFPRGKRDRVR